ncbi:PLP-dependent transferase [Rhodococcus sp. BP-241]|uniref:trans-sulfuration enzyme family protein n=1 Tax=Rhodococcus sp. BP-241 TaxID=2739441 RepID=UPI001C9B0A16|nr:PLP-dependent transferase [Rhodococcus sp. BP-241]MBY6708613.1 PLP-dependent transferase [Rhodococcus sp. BP-241]
MSHSSQRTDVGNIRAASSPLRPESLAIRAGRGTGAFGDPLNVPITPASNFLAAPTSDGREYSRDDGTPSWEALEEVLGALDGGDAVAFSSGMAAATAVLDCMPSGSVIVAPNACYSGVLAGLEDGRVSGRWTPVLVDISDTAAVSAVAADLVWIESPTNPLLEVADIAAITAAAHDAGALVVVDSTFATALRQRPLDLGADIVIHSATKFIGGHSDLLLGVVVTSDASLLARLRRRREVGGATPGALETFLALRGVRTMALRLAHGERSAGELARRLHQSPHVQGVRYPGLPDDPGHERATRQTSGYGAILAFELADAATADSVCEAVDLIVSATSVGGVESTIERRAKLPGQEHVPAGLLRLSVGCEDIEDLWNDLTRAIDVAVSGLSRG